MFVPRIPRIRSLEIGSNEKLQGTPGVCIYLGVFEDTGCSQRPSECSKKVTSRGVVYPRGVALRTSSLSRSRSRPMAHKSKRAADKAVLKLKVSGPAIHSGRIPIPDLVRICQEVQNTVNRQAEAMEGRKTIHPGPVMDQIRKECTLELVGIRKGSTTLCFQPTASQPRIPYPDQRTFLSDAIGQIASTIKDLGNGKEQTQDIDAGVLLGLYTFGNLADGKRITQIQWTAPKSDGHKRISAPVNKIVRDRVAAQLSSPRKQSAQVDGILDMADFKPTELRCRIDPAIGAPVLCTFEERDSGQILALLREPVRVNGEGTFQPYTHKLESLHIRSIQRLPSLALGEGNFDADLSITALATTQKVKPLRSVSELSGGFPDDEDIDEFLKEIYRARK